MEAAYFIEATPYGDLLALAGVEHVVGAESRKKTGEPHASAQADPREQQAITVCFAIEHLPGEDHTIEKPREYALWREASPPGWPGRLLSWTTVRPETHEPLRRFLFQADDDPPWWRFRRILDRNNFLDGFAPSDVTVVNWPQNDYWLGPVVGVDAAEQARHLDAARQLSLSLLYWMQTEAPRPDGGVGYPGLRLRGDVVGGTADGLAPAPYVRESRRLRAEFTVLEQHIAYPLRPKGPELLRRERCVSRPSRGMERGRGGRAARRLLHRAESDAAGGAPAASSAPGISIAPGGFGHRAFLAIARADVRR